MGRVRDFLNKIGLEHKPFNNSNVAQPGSVGIRPHGKATYKIAFNKPQLIGAIVHGWRIHELVGVQRVMNSKETIKSKFVYECY